MASTRISTSSADIITLEMRSRPFCSPKLHTMKPATTISTIHSSISPGLAFMASNTPLMAAVSSPSKVPETDLTK